MFSRQAMTGAPFCTRKLGWGVALGFTLKGLLTAALIVFAAVKALDIF